MMHHHVDRRTLAAVVALCVATWVSPALAGFVPGGGNNEADCYAGLDVTGVTSSANRIECTEGDACDIGGCGDGACTFGFLICVNQPGVSGCTPPAAGLRILKAPEFIQSSIPVDLTGTACGRPFSFDLKLKRNGQKANKRVIRMKAFAATPTKPGKDQDSFTFICKPRTTDCPASPSAAFLP
jgi:hypothetical protein